MDLEVEDTVAKLQVRDGGPKRIKELQFGVLSCEDIVDQGVVQVSDRHVYDLIGTEGGGRPITEHGPLDKRMGTSNNSTQCQTCNLPLGQCNGHFGYVKLALPTFHIGFIKKIIEILHCICKECSRVLLDEKASRAFMRSLNRSTLDSLEQKAIVKKVMAECRKSKLCSHCGASNGTVKKVPGHALKIVHEKYRWFTQSTAKSKTAPPSKIAFDYSFEEARKFNPELDKHVRKAFDDLNPLRVLNLFQKIQVSECILLGMKPSKGLPETLIVQYVPAPPVAIRPSVAQEGASTEDDITNKLGDIVQISSIIRAGIDKGQPVQTIMEQWDYLQIQVAMYINSEVPNLQQTGFGKPIRGFCQRLKGKQGRFRGNLSGKRVDFSGRTVISPDPNLSIDEVAIPERVAKNLTYPERVTEHNLEKLKTLVRRGPFKHPGANSVVKKSTGLSQMLAYLVKVKKLDDAAANLKYGDVVHRHLEDGDIVLFNRQPSLHKLSILCHRAKIRHWRTFRLNECVCTPYNADFDGDEMNLHVPQTEEARTEALELMGVKHNLATPKDGTPIIAATQDFLTCAYLISNKDQFFDRRTFAQICAYMFDGSSVQVPNGIGYTFENVDLPEPTIWKPEILWTGKQVFNVLMRPTLKSDVLVNVEGPCKQYRKVDGVDPHLNQDDSWLCIQNSEIMCGVMDKSTLGSGKKDSVFYVLMRDYGPDTAVQAMNRVAKLSARWLSNEGFSIGISDVYPGKDLVRRKQALIADAYARCDDLILKYRKGDLRRDPGCDEEQTMENKISGILSEVRREAGNICFEQLSNWNSPIIMAKSGSKGSNINVAQMVASVGQQIINGNRVADGFQDRTLPHFPKAARQPPSKGFVQSSFFSGLSPTEFIFHAMSGREGLVDTAVKTAETGYMSRRLMKSLEDLSAQYDWTVRNSSAGIVQFRFGEDGLDPTDMEGRAKPVNFERTFKHAQASTWSNEEESLLPDQIISQTAKRLASHKKELSRESLTGIPLAYDDHSDKGIDHKESKRDFLAEVENFLARKADDLQHVRTYLSVKREKESGRRSSRRSNVQPSALKLADGVAKVSERALERFLDMCLTKYEKSKVQPGHAVGAVGAQSIGEPGTQMTLKTFHFAGVAGMSITQGVPRIKEIINGSKVISTPVISCELVNKSNERAARLIKSRIEKTYLKDIIEWIDEIWSREKKLLRVKVDPTAIQELQLDVTLPEIKDALLKTRGLKLTEESIRVRGDYLNILPELMSSTTTKSRSKVAPRDGNEDIYLKIQRLKRQLPGVAIKGLPQASRAVITKTGSRDKSGAEENKLLVEGYGFRDCMVTPGIDGYRTSTNNVDEINRVLGIEAARNSIIVELNAVMGESMDIDPRHMQLLADVMTFKGDVLGITRFGLAKMRDSVLQLASFEKTPDHLFDAAVKGQTDPIEGVSECIIMGQGMKIGTGAMGVVRPMNLQPHDLKKKPTLFEDAFR